MKFEYIAVSSVLSLHVGAAPFGGNKTSSPLSLNGNRTFEYVLGDQSSSNAAEPGPIQMPDFPEDLPEIKPGSDMPSMNPDENISHDIEQSIPANDQQDFGNESPPVKIEPFSTVPPPQRTTLTVVNGPTSVPINDDCEGCDRLDDSKSDESCGSDCSESGWWDKKTQMKEELLEKFKGKFEGGGCDEGCFYKEGYVQIPTSSTETTVSLFKRGLDWFKKFKGGYKDDYDDSWDSDDDYDDDWSYDDDYYDPDYDNEDDEDEGELNWWEKGYLWNKKQAEKQKFHDKWKAEEDYFKKILGKEDSGDNYYDDDDDYYATTVSSLKARGLDFGGGNVCDSCGDDGKEDWLKELMDLKYETKKGFKDKFEGESRCGDNSCDDCSTGNCGIDLSKRDTRQKANQTASVVSKSAVIRNSDGKKIEIPASLGHKSLVKFSNDSMACVCGDGSNAACMCSPKSSNINSMSSENKSKMKSAQNFSLPATEKSFEESEFSDVKNRLAIGGESYLPNIEQFDSAGTVTKPLAKVAVAVGLIVAML